MAFYNSFYLPEKGEVANASSLVVIQARTHSTYDLPNNGGSLVLRIVADSFQRPKRHTRQRLLAETARHVGQTFPLVRFEEGETSNFEPGTNGVSNVQQIEQ